ncbi:MAG: DUF3859 domain-containing protein [Desulfobacterales bacterium]|jgi:hypothetical protein
MRTGFRAGILICLLLFVGTDPVRSDDGVVIQLAKVLKAGRYEANLIKRQKGRRNIYEKIKFVEETTRIPIIKGHRFGLRFVIVGEPAYKEIELRIFRHHPPVKNPRHKETSSLTTYTRKAQLNIAQVIGYGFDEDWEMVPGEHRFQVYYGPKKLIEQVFTVYRP